MRVTVRRRSGMFLPIVLVMLVLMMTSVIIVTGFGSNTRTMLQRSELSQRCRLAATSAILEARRASELQLSKPVSEWDADSWWRQLLPPLTASAIDPNGEMATATEEAFREEGIELDGPVVIECLHKRARHGRAQGLLAFSVAIKATFGLTSTISIKREERVRFMVWRHPGQGLRILLLPGHECAAVRVSS